MNAHALQLPHNEPPPEIQQKFDDDNFLHTCAEVLEERVKVKLQEKIEEIIREQLVPETFVAGVSQLLADPSGGEPIRCEARVKVEPAPVAVFGNRAQFVPFQSPIQITHHQAPQPADLGQAIAQAADRHAGQPLNQTTVAAVQHDIAQAILNHQPLPPTIPHGTQVADQAGNTFTLDTETAGLQNLYQYQAGPVEWTQGQVTLTNNNIPLTVNLGTGGGAEQQIQYRWLLDGNLQGAVGTGGWTTYGTAQQATYTTAYTYAQPHYVTMGATVGGYVPGNATGAITYTDNYAYNIDTNGITWSYGVGAPLSKRDQLKQKFRNQLNGIERKRLALQAGVSVAELKARDTLRDMLSEADWRRYVTNSFIMVRGESGKWYQVFANHNYERIRVYEKGEHTANLCIHSDSECPLSDHVIAMKIQIELDEDSLWRESNTFDRRGHSASNQVFTIPYVEGGAAVLNAQGQQDPMPGNAVLGEMLEQFIASNQNVQVNMVNPYNTDPATLAC